MKNFLNYLDEKSVMLTAAVFAFLSPVFAFMALTGLMVALDYFTGIRAAQKRGETICSTRRKDTVTKTIVYFSALLISHGCELIFEFPYLLKITGAFIAYTELTSIDENYYEISGKRLFSFLKEKLNMNKNNEK
jgi:hypothetical protein